MRPERTKFPLVTTGSVTDAHPGALGQPGTSVVVGNKLNFNNLSGTRLNMGFFVDNSSTFSLEFDGLYYAQGRFSQAAASGPTGLPIIARPVFAIADDPTFGPIERAYVDSQPGFGSTVLGGAQVDFHSQLYGFEINGRCHADLAPDCRANFLFGFRQLHLSERLTIADALQPLSDDILTFAGGLVAAGSLLTDIDEFHTINNFYGLQIGGQMTWQEDWFFLSAFGKLAVGPTVERVEINGSTTLFSGGGITTAPGGILALPSNIGNYHRTVVSVVPEFGANIGINVTPNVQVLAGYSFLLWSQVVRPGYQIDHNVNQTTVPTDINFGVPLSGPAAPLFRFNGELFWIHQFNVGLNVHF
jgi:hypothetical protein